MENENIKETKELEVEETPKEETKSDETAEKSQEEEKQEPSFTKVSEGKAKIFGWLKKFFTLKKIIIILIVIIVLGLVYYFKGLFIAATVNNSVISRFAVISELEKGSGKAALDSMISERLIELEAAKKNITISNEEINAEFEKISKQLEEQGLTLEAALAEQGLTKADISKRMMVQKKLEKMLADKVNVTDQEIDQYIKDNGITLPKDKEAEAKDSIREQIKSNKLNEEARKFIDDLKANAKINRWVNY